MRFKLRSAAVLNPTARALIASALCVLLVEQPLVAAVKKPAKKPVQTKVKQIEGQERVLHTLNRFTFGPRPGDVAAVEAIGLDKWFERQLNPSTIDDSAFEARLDMFPAMRMDQVELLRRYPGPVVLRQIIDKNLPLPTDPLEYAIYRSELALYKAQQAKQQEKKAEAEAADKTDGRMKSATMSESSRDKTALPGDKVDPGVPSMKVHEEQLYSGLEAVKIINLPPEQRIMRILEMTPDELVAFRKGLNPQEVEELVEGLTPLQRETLAALQGSPRMIGAELLETRMLRDIYSERQLEAVMTDFWLNHFNVYVRKNQDEPYLLAAYERDVIRPNALGRFEDLLVATAKSPAMQMYLDNWQSIGPNSVAAGNGQKIAQMALNPQVKQALTNRGLNENYARELMELHTLGVQCEVSENHPVSKLDKSCGQGYTQQDVTQVAKVLTGWTIDQPYRRASYRFDPRWHEPGTKSVLGRTIVESGQDEGIQVLHMLASSPATAKFVSTKLAVRFVSDAPPAALVDRMAKSFEASDGDIKTVLRTMFSSPEFWSTDVYRAKMKTPEEFVVSAVRASGAEVKNAIPLTQSLERLGMPLYGMQTPNGYTWTQEPWVNTGDLVNRMNFALSLSSDRVAGVQTNWTGLLGASATIQSAKEGKLEVLLLGQPASDRTRATVLAQLQDPATPQQQQQAAKSFPVRVNEVELMGPALNPAALNRQVRPPVDREAAMMAGLLLGSPEFQRR
ncbi:MAG TPA: DUF1800 domain-containing protein [Edaphobacter sp.]|jgi:uncharacterized protein (DUF1800 family)|nr:DUF1800 domain-containing protein [Edaphobacter sp.]